MSRLVDYEALPDFLESLGFTCVTFSYPLRQLGSSFLGYSDSHLVDFTNEELDEAFERIKRLKKRFLVLNPTPSLEEMQRFVKHETQRFPCLGGFQYFHLDWHLMLWRGHCCGHMRWFKSATACSPPTPFGVLRCVTEASPCRKRPQ